MYSYMENDYAEVKYKQKWSNKVCIWCKIKTKYINFFLKFFLELGGSERKEVRDIL